MKHLYLLFILVTLISDTFAFRIFDRKLKQDSTEGQYLIKFDSQNAVQRSAPYLVSISISSVAYGHSCSGIIISKEWVLTAAHCVEMLKTWTENIHNIPVLAGLTNRTDIDKAQIRTINFAFSHKEFDTEAYTDDIALLHVTPPFQFNADVKAITLPLKEEQFTNKSSAHYGWGSINSAEPLFEKNLQVTKSKIIDHEKCKALLPNASPLSEEKHVCFKMSACYGDGGSPLVIEYEGDVELIGIASWGYVPCGYNNRPTVYTAVSHYITWITEVQWAYSVLH